MRLSCVSGSDELIFHVFAGIDVIPVPGMRGGQAAGPLDGQSASCKMHRRRSPRLEGAVAGIARKRGQPSKKQTAGN
jgi:hypothetical protein